MSKRIKGLLSILALVFIVVSSFVIFGDFSPFLKNESLRKESNVIRRKLTGTVLEKGDNFFILFVDDNSEPLKLGVSQKTTSFYVKNNFENDEGLREKYEKGEMHISEILKEVDYGLLQVGDYVDVFFRIEGDKREATQISISK